jgi:hypothetical protein
MGGFNQFTNWVGEQFRRPDYAGQIQQGIENSPQYQTSPYMNEMLGLAKSQYEGGVQGIDEYLDILRSQAEFRNVDTRLPNQDILEENIAAGASRGYRQAERAADTSSALLGAQRGVYGNQVQALMDLGTKQQTYAAQMKREEQARVDRAKENLAQGYLTEGQLGRQATQDYMGALQMGSQEDFNKYMYNENIPWQQEMNFLTSQYEQDMARRNANKQMFGNLAGTALQFGLAPATGGASLFGGTNFSKLFSGIGSLFGGGQSSFAPPSYTSNVGLGGSGGYKGM